MTAPKQSHWLPLFHAFIAEMRISSKEIASEDDRGVPLVLWESQRRFLEEVAHGLDRGIRTFMCLKSRQLGITTVSLAIDLFYLAMHKNLTCALVTENEKNRDKNRAMLRQYMKSFPTEFFGDSFYIVKGGDNRSSMRFSNGSSIDFLVAGTKKKGTSWGEGSGYTFAHLTECAAYGGEDGLKSFEEAFAQNNPNRLYIYESTAKGFNLWSDKWKAAKADHFTKHAFFIGFWASDTNRIERGDPRFARFGMQAASGEEREKVAAVAHLYNYKIQPEQLAWYRWRQQSDSAEGGDLNMLDQNQPWTEHDAFVESGYSFFMVRQISKDLQALDNAPPGFVEDGGVAYKGYRYDLGNDFFDMTMFEEKEDPEEIQLRVWEEPVPEGQYLIGCDPAYGRNDHGDANAISVWRGYADKLVQVAEFADAHKIEVKQAAWILAHLSGAYENCVVNYEVNGPGNIIKLEFDHLRGQLNAEMNAVAVKDRRWENALANARWYLYARPDSSARPSAIGFSTTFNNKAALMHQMRGSYVTRELVIRSKKLLGEMHNVKQEGSTIGAPESRSADCKDDRVFAAAFAVRAWIEWVRPGMLAQGLTYSKVNEHEMTTDDMTPQGRLIKQRVDRFLLTQQQIADNPPKAAQWRLDRHFA